jgi:serine/threonine protein kinase/tetratricopeptide (TPR) repeat protein
MKCPKCNSDNPDSQRFCGECGTKLQPAKDISLSRTKTLKTPSSKIIAGKYQILEELGRGGMGVVYKAKDTRLDRTVALKFLPPEYTQDKEAKERFIQEAKAAASLDHNNICTVYEIGESEGKTFIAMPCYEGETLKEKIEHEPLKIDEAIDITKQIGRGLEKAHGKGIIHRDIKPANIMITHDGVAKIVDFGLAKLSGQVKLTRTGTTMGTAAYMSPEQAQGDAVDHRTDIWSLGVVLYEMLTGKLPFKGEQMQSMVYSIMNKEPDSLASLRSDIPKHIENAVLSALEKDVSQRYKTIRELINDLKQSPPITLTKAEKSIVVLPFDDMSPDKDNEYFSDGLTEEIITDLSQIHSLGVISKNSAMALKGTRKNTKTIGRELNVQYVLEGSVRKAGDNLRITAQLIDARTDVHLWAKKYSGTLDDVFDIQEKVSRSIVDALKVKLSPEENRKIAERSIDNVTAYDCYLRARQAILQLSEEGLRRALQLIQTGLNIIGENEILYALLGYVYVQFINVGVTKDESFLKKAEDNVNKTFSLNQDSSLGYSIMGQIHWKRGDIQEAVRDLKKALTIDPNSPEALYWLAWIYMFSGKEIVAKPLLKKLIEIDPLTPANYLMLGICDLFIGKFEDSLQNYYKSYLMDQKSPLCGFGYAWALISAQKQNEAFKVIDLMSKDLPHELFTDLGLFYKYALQKDKEKAFQTVTDNLKSYAKRDEIIPIFLAECYALLNEKEEAISWIEHGIRWGFINYPFLNEIDPFLKNIRAEPRFKKLMERVKHEWENFEV